MTKDLTERLKEAASRSNWISDGPHGVFEQPHPDKALLTEAASLIQRLEGERDEAIRFMSQYAREAGEAKGRLEMSEAAGIVDGWRERANAAEQALSASQKEVERLTGTGAELLSAVREALSVLDIADHYGLYEPGSLGDADVKDCRTQLRRAHFAATGRWATPSEIALGGSEELIGAEYDPALQTGGKEHG